jgi:hypothetical protein
MRANENVLLRRRGMSLNPAVDGNFDWIKVAILLIQSIHTHTLIQPMAEEVEDAETREREANER